MLLALTLCCSHHDAVLLVPFPCMIACLPLIACYVHMYDVMKGLACTAANAMPF